MDSRTLILFDVDGVLVHPVGYKAALRATVDRFAVQMGQPAPGVTHDEIAVFEACGLTNEWDSGAVCVSEIMLAALESHPALRRTTLEDTFAAIQAAAPPLPRPDFVKAAREIAQHTTDGQVPAVVYLALISARTDPAHEPLLRALLGDVYNVKGTLTTRVFQTHTLGHARFAATYGYAAPFESGSYLAEYDTPLISPENRARLLDWIQPPDRGAAIFTARPSLYPADLPADQRGQPASGYAPEAELAAELIGLHGKLPLIGQGRIGWLAWRSGRGAAEYLKPSPVQALAAIGAAAFGSETSALQAAVTFFEHGELTGPLAALDHSTRVIVFEDSAGGIRATRRACELLHSAGLDVSFSAIGVSPQGHKRAALDPVADQVVDDVNAGLALLWD
jgi:beta-phosphoglucomutase-like phosphatase (HAD superfamily)